MGNWGPEASCTARGAQTRAATAGAPGGPRSGGAGGGAGRGRGVFSGHELGGACTSRPQRAKRGAAAERMQQAKAAPDTGRPPTAAPPSPAPARTTKKGRRLAPARCCAAGLHAGRRPGGPALAPPAAGCGRPVCAVKALPSSSPAAHVGPLGRLGQLERGVDHVGAGGVQPLRGGQSTEQCSAGHWLRAVRAQQRSSCARQRSCHLFTLFQPPAAPTLFTKSNSVWLRAAGSAGSCSAWTAA